MESFFSAEGRLNRRPFFFRGLALSIPSMLLLELPKELNIALSTGTHLTFLVLVLAAVILSLIQTVKRLHDLDMSGWFALAMLVPLVNFIFGLFLTFKKGTEGPNTYGTDPLAGPELASEPPAPVSGDMG